MASGDYLGAKFAPSAGWFIYDGVQVAYTHELYAGMRDSTDFFASMAVADVTLHLPIEDRLLWFFGADEGDDARRRLLRDYAKKGRPHLNDRAVSDRDHFHPAVDRSPHDG